MQTHITAQTQTPDRRLDSRTADQERSNINHILNMMMDLSRLVPKTALSLQVRRILTPFLIDNAARMVRSLVRLLRDHPEDMAHADQDPDALEALQDRADLLKELRSQLYHYYILANDGYIETQAEAVARTRDAAARVSAHNRQSYGSLDAPFLRRESLLARIFALDPRAPKAKNPRRPRGAQPR